MDPKLLASHPQLADVMWKRLSSTVHGDVAAIIVDATGMDYYTNGSGAVILECIERGLSVGEIFGVLREMSEPTKPDMLVTGAAEFLQVLVDKNIITLVS